MNHQWSVDDLFSGMQINISGMMVCIFGLIACIPQCGLKSSGFWALCWEANLILNMQGLDSGFAGNIVAFSRRFSEDRCLYGKLVGFF
jgi:hypothetical protein